MYVTLRIDGDVGARRAAVDEAVGRAGGSAAWRTNEGLRRSYALLELPDEISRADIESAGSGTLFERPVIALALFPTVTEALSPLVEALAGAGRPAGVLSSSLCGNAAIVEWDPAITQPHVIFDLIDLELARFRSGRVVELLSPLPPPLVARIAAAGLQAPQIEPRRVLDLQIERP